MLIWHVVLVYTLWANLVQTKRKRSLLSLILGRTYILYEPIVFEEKFTSSNNLFGLDFKHNGLDSHLYSVLKTIKTKSGQYWNYQVIKRITLGTSEMI